MIILFGAIGSGKTEQGQRLARRLRCPWISTSRLLRAHSDPLHLQQIAQGSLVGDQDVLDILDPELKKAGADKNELILDGAPRSTGQAQWLIDKIKAGEIKFTAIIYLKVPEQMVVERLIKRGRADDKPDIIHHRLGEYTLVTRPVLKYLEQAGYHVDVVDGSPLPEQVERNIKIILDTK